MTYLIIFLIVFFGLAVHFSGDIANFLRRKRARRLRDKIKAGKASKKEIRNYEKYYYFWV